MKYITTIHNYIEDPDTGDTYFYSFTATSTTSEAAAIELACIYASMIEFAIELDRISPPTGMAFPREQLYQFVTPALLEQMERIYPDTVQTAYNNAVAYVQSYIGAMFDVDAMIEAGGTTSTDLTLRLALCISTATFILSSAPQYSDVVKQLNEQLLLLLRGLKSGQRSFGKNSVVGEPNVRMEIVSLARDSKRP